VVTDLNGKTSIEGLYAAGEVASTGVHGGNRLASNSLLEAMIFATSAANSSAGSQRPAAGSAPDGGSVQPRAIAEAEAVRIRRALQRTMTNNVGIVRTFSGLREAQQMIESLIREYDSLPEAPFSAYPLETRNLLIAARYVVDGALERDRNVGLHFNADLVDPVN
jgi:L-aspartate oxidase